MYILHNNIEDDKPATPNEYYDNDDGFWDDYIQGKIDSRGIVPINRHRPHVRF